jgi:type I restriction enzyme S subunit
MASKWRQLEIGNQVDILTGFPFSSEHYTEDPQDIRLLRGDNIVQGALRWEGAKRWPASRSTDLERYRLAVNDIVIAMDRTWVKAGLKAAQIREADLPSLLVQRVARLRTKNGLDLDYLAQCITSYRFEQYVKGNQTETAVPHISSQQICSFTIPVPRIEEQRRIAAVLRTWDEAIEMLGALSQAVATLGDALCRSTFEKDFQLHPCLVRASKLFEPVSERVRPDLPLLAVMQDVGIVRRDGLDRRVAMPEGDTSTYKVVRPGDFVISLRSFEGGLEYSNVLGLVSPAYTVLRPIREIHSEYYRHFFKSRSFVGRLDKLIFGIRDGKQIAFRDFGDMRIPHPHIEIQKAEAAVLNDVRTLHDLNQKRKQALERQKRGLMQKLLTGKWRVKADGGAL